MEVTQLEEKVNVVQASADKKGEESEKAIRILEKSRRVAEKRVFQVAPV